jgi:hypothetical protein
MIGESPSSFGSVYRAHTVVYLRIHRTVRLGFY